jgi:phosphohistidine phosphatase
MKLYLVQHGAALAKEVDPNRPLSGSGRGAIQRLAALLGSRHATVHRILHSDKSRAAQTAKLLADVLSPQGGTEEVPGLRPKDSAAEFAAGIDKTGAGLMIVGHMPFLGRLAAHLVTGGEEADCISFVPGTLVLLEANEAGKWAISCVLPPWIVGETG